MLDYRSVQEENLKQFQQQIAQKRFFPHAERILWNTTCSEAKLNWVELSLHENTVDVSEIRRAPVEVGSLSDLSHHLQGFSTIPTVVFSPAFLVAINCHGILSTTKSCNNATLFPEILWSLLRANHISHTQGHVRTTTYHGPPNTCLEVFMVNNLVFRWPKPLFFMFFHGIEC